MKKLLLLMTGFLMTAAVKTNAQYLSIGPVGGFGHSQVTGLDGTTQFKISPYLGAGIIYSRKSHWGLGAEIGVSHEGFKKNYDDAFGGTYSMAYNPVYLCIPLRAYYFFGDYGAKVRPKVYLGPSFGIKVDEMRYFNGSKVDNNNDAGGVAMQKDIFNGFDLGVNAGAGVNIKVMRATWLNLSLDYYQGVLDAVNVDNSGYNTNQNLRVNVGLMFGLR